MSLDPSAGRRSISPASSGRSSPVPRASRRAVEDGVYKADKQIRRYAAGIERALASWEANPQEWADYIAFLGRLLKAIQSHLKDVPILPCSQSIASRLAQCLNPALPSGVHQRALEVYAYIFELLGTARLASHIHEFLPGLSTVLSFASLSVRPSLYYLYEDYITRLSAEELRPALKSLVLSIFPALEDETSEDFDRAFNLLEKLRSIFAQHGRSAEAIDLRGRYWQCLFLASITSTTRRQGALNYLVRTLPDLGRRSGGSEVKSGADDSIAEDVLSANAREVLNPEPGLLIRCFACGLADPQTLIQRGFLDLLISRLPMNSNVLQAMVPANDLDRLVTSALQILLRRDTGLNRRLWAWFLGPEPSNDAGSGQMQPPEETRRNGARELGQMDYFVQYGEASLERSLLAMFAREGSNPTMVARPFRISLSLMDRWEIGGSVASKILLPALHCAHRYCIGSSKSDAAELLRSASLFFDGVEAHQIWSSLFSVLRSAFDGDSSTNEGLSFLSWIVQNFNMSDNEMLSVHIPYIALYLTMQLANIDKKVKIAPSMGAHIIETIRVLVELLPPHILGASGDPSSLYRIQGPVSQEGAVASISTFYGMRPTSDAKPLDILQVAGLLAQVTTDAALQTLIHNIPGLFSGVSALLLLYSAKMDRRHLPSERLLHSITAIICDQEATATLMTFDTLTSIVRLLTIHNLDKDLSSSSFDGLQPALTTQVWKRLSPFLPKHHVEAVRLFWQLEGMGTDSGDVTATLTQLVRAAQQDAARPDVLEVDDVRCLMTLWEHTITHDETSYSGGKNRRGSAMPKVDAKDERHHQDVLTGPLFLLLDLLDAQNKRTADVVAQWLGHVPSLGRILSMLVARISLIVKSTRGAGGSDPRQTQRKTKSEHRELDCHLRHMRAILERANTFVWQRLYASLLPDFTNQMERALVVLAAACLELVAHARPSSTEEKDLDRSAVFLLQLLFSGPMAHHLRQLEAETVLIDSTTSILDGPSADLQGPLLTVLSLALKVRLLATATVTPVTREPTRASISARSHLTQNDNDHASSPPSSAPPPRLLSCIQAGFSAHSARFYLDHWLVFLADVLPIFADAIFSNLLPLVSGLCKTIQQCFDEVTNVSSVNGIDTAKAPETTLLNLVEALDMVLARAHECLVDQMTSEPEARTEASKRSQAPVISSMFKEEAPPSKTARSNTRLTVILAFQDAVRMCLNIWFWASDNADHSREDQSSSATTVYNALKMRNRTRRLLDQIFAVEPLESMEVLIAAWCQATEPAQATAFLSLLHVMNCTRPRSSVPAMFDALCSRTNPSDLDADRRSSLTCDISAQDVTMFMATYLDTLENDALDEIWSDCLAFLRAVSRDSLPYRSVLPTLMRTVVLLAEKLEKTNFGEQRKMRREIADMFQRLLNATLATVSPGMLVNANSEDSEPLSSLETSMLTTKRDCQLGPVLCHLLVNLEVVTETPDRVIALTNLVNTSLLTPLFHSKAFPSNINGVILAVLLQTSKTAPTAKSWKKDVLDAFSEPRFLLSPFDLVRDAWFPVLRQWCLNDRDRMPDILSRLTPPSSAGIMFGVGANAARLEADRKTQLALRRACILLLAAPEDIHAANMSYFEEKLAELHGATLSSSPSSAIKPELFMLCRALALAISPVHLVPLWPMINDTLQSALSSLLPRSSTKDGAFTNLSLLQACKLLDLLIGLSLEEFQLHEWLYITDTIDAVYQPTEWHPLALADHVSEELGIANLDDSATVLPPPLSSSDADPTKAPLSSSIAVDARDAKVMAREDFARVVLRPFLSQLSMHAYEGVYNSDNLDIAACKDDLLRDILDMSTIVE